MSRYQSGDATAFEALYSRHSMRIFSYLRKRVSEGDSRELLQEVFEKLHVNRLKYNPQYPFLPWIFTLTRNSVFDFAKKAETKLAMGSVTEPIVLENVTQNLVVEGDQDISSILQGLPSTQKRAIELRYLQDWSFEKIAVEMNTSEENTRQIISRAIRKLKLALGGDS